jgi:hypothetical protein
MVCILVCIDDIVESECLIFLYAEDLERYLLEQGNDKSTIYGKYVKKYVEKGYGDGVMYYPNFIYDKARNIPKEHWYYYGCNYMSVKCIILENNDIVRHKVSPHFEK